MVGGEERVVSHQHLYILPAVTKEKLHHCPSNCNLKKSMNIITIIVEIRFPLTGKQYVLLQDIYNDSK